ncbi:D-mannonate oxidoreductase [Sodalis praecaptivus]|uniref:D-mannonate oxidoreductase n=1 Tax=Sodalis praecaptivus TaxID=1239307 RepID=K7TG16_9GAMM|nr:mannitol dehydrogenase family protein [Sodalis praecaptivus]AFW03700.1 D-mannonate oxidoreductase [Sodalis praecaptivus]AHF76469.1 D-mannonate oxidoreductase [Sodalis praecaptivus]
MPTIASVSLPEQVQQPGYDRHRLAGRIVHIGFGAFHRAHQGVMTDRVLNRHGGDWGICEVSLHSADLLQALRRQDHLYTVLVKGPDGARARVIGAVCDSLVVAEQGIDALLAKLAEPQVAIVSLTITEKGYCIEPGSGQLDRTHPGVIADLAAPHAPGTVPGILVEALNLRYRRGLAPFTVLSCDNIPGNGQVVRASVLGLAQARDAALGRWIADHASFPATMVDRIVPAASEEVLADVAAMLGVRDPCAIACEPFIQWVIEDHFVAGRPQWERAGAQLVDDVAPFEEMKLRMLNGSHSFLAWLGYLSGYPHISDCMNDATLRAAVEKLMINEQAPTLRAIEGVDTGDYARQLLTRFANPALKHRTWQIAMDSSQKLPQRILDPLRWHLRHGSSAPLLTLAVAGWMRYAGGTDERGQPIDIRDPLQSALADIAARHEDGPGRVRAWLALRNVFGQDLPENPTFVAAVTEAYRSLMQHGALATVAGLLND